MSLEDTVRQTLEQNADRGGAFDQQKADFREFEQQMTDGGYQIERETFSIPLIHRMSTSYLYT